MSKKQKPIAEFPPVEVEAEVVDDIFAQAAMQTIEQTRSIKIKQTDKVITQANLTPAVKGKTRKDWNELRKAIDTEHAERFNAILNALPDREFARVYLKSLEFFKPKIIRQTGEKPKETDTNINIRINR